MSIATEPRAVPALDLKAQYQAIRGEIDEAIRSVVQSQYFILGPEVAGLESEIARYCRVPQAIGCSSGSDALLLPLIAWGIEPGDEVIMPPYTFFATAGAVWRLGARPVFVDIQADSYNLDPELVEAAITPKTRALIPVHLFGQAADMDPLVNLAQKANLKILEDAAQAIGAGYKGRAVCGIGDAAALSFYPSKNLGGFGDGGMVATRDEALARQLARLRVHGMEPKYHHQEVGYNARLDAIQAAVLRVKLRHLPAWTAARREAADRYRALFQEYRLSEVITLPMERPGHFHVYNQYVIRVPESSRDPLRDHLAARKIGTEIYYPIPLHLQPCFASLGYQVGDFPQAESAARQTIALPIYPELTEEAQDLVVASIAEFFQNHAPRTA